MNAQPTPNNALVASANIGQEGGPRVIVKDCIDIAGLTSACGSAALQSAPVASENAEVVDAVLSGGCQIVGKANMHELAFGMTGVNETFGTPINPRWPDRICGGSSSGSAVAVAAGMCDFAIGTDTGGSVRQPAVCCGVYGIKPTYGRVSRKGCHPAQSSLDCVGVFASDASTLTTAMVAIDPSFEPQKLAQAPRLSRVKSDVDEKLGQHLVYGLMEGAPDAGYTRFQHFDAAFEAGMILISAEAAAAYGPLLDEDALIGADIRARLTAAQNITKAQIAQAEIVREAFTAEVDAALEEVDALITPALPSVPPTCVEARDPATVLPLTKFLRPFNLSGHPSLVLPMLAGPEELPAGLQIIGRKGEDEKLCAIAEWMAETMPVFGPTFGANIARAKG